MPGGFFDEAYFDRKVEAAIRMLAEQPAPLVEGPHSGPIGTAIDTAWGFEYGMPHKGIVARRAYTKRVYDRMMAIPQHREQVQKFCQQAWSLLAERA